MKLRIPNPYAIFGFGGLLLLAGMFYNAGLAFLNAHIMTIGTLHVALTEAVNNAIHHGNGLDPAKSVTVGYVVKGDRIIFMVQDQGPGFDHDHLPDPTDPQNIEKPHGRGVFLMRALADSVEFSDHGATVAMAFSLQPITE